MSNRVFTTTGTFVTASASGSRIGLRTNVPTASPVKDAHKSSSNARISFTLELYQTIGWRRIKNRGIKLKVASF